MQFPEQDLGFTPNPDNHSPATELLESKVPTPLENSRSADDLEAASIKWNVARIVRLSSGNFALLTHYRAGALDLIKVGTIEEIVDFIPTSAQCEPERTEPKLAKPKGDVSDLLADIGLT